MRNNNNNKLKSLTFFIFLALPVLLMSACQTQCMNKNQKLSINTTNIGAQNKEFRVIKIDAATIDDFLTKASEIFSNKTSQNDYKFGVCLVNEDDLYLEKRKIIKNQIEKMLDIFGNSLVELHLIEFNLKEILSENPNTFVKKGLKNQLPEKLRKSNITKLKISSCKNIENVAQILFDNLPQKLEALIITELIPADFCPKFKWPENLPSTIKFLDLSGIKYEAPESFFKNLNKLSVEKLKLGCPVESTHLGILSTDSELKSLCLKHTKIKNIINGSLENCKFKKLKKLCVPKNFKDKDIKYLNFLPKLKNLDISSGLYSEGSPDFTGENIDELQKKLNLIKFDTQSFSNIKEEYLKKFTKDTAKEIYIKQYFSGFKRSEYDKEKINVLEKSGIKVTDYKPTLEARYFGLNNKFISCSNIYNLQDPNDFGSPDSYNNLSYLGSPDD